MPLSINEIQRYNNGEKEDSEKHEGLYCTTLRVVAGTLPATGPDYCSRTIIIELHE